ncbi:lipoyl(octanoyl) transferase LipB [Sandaracinobacter neustonicus]|uniref:Octanoyltransferase n=1 Tax=Sandaracinobacter neustonicus TaxID=1715348 RepID=A0A501XD69_9SPHN|nr:lipoyl(octanoyl) transferase LipB [Sandaracinobacter neustonicus]TPE58530.1 lipoyl(octanoyl) transferase LipB [Sandaracinobacter neustonicus]
METLPDPIWRPFPGLSDYAETVSAMEAHVSAMMSGNVGEEIWLVEHPPVLTAGTSTTAGDLLQPGRFPIHDVGRGGRITYHGPGQRVVYPMLDLGKRGRDVRRYVAGLEAWAIAALGELGIEAGISDAGTGIWVQTRTGLAKIGAIGVRVRRWISFHGLSLNVSTDLGHFSAIVPCGIAGHGVARVVDLAPLATMQALDEALSHNLPVLMHSLSASAPPRIKTLEAASDCR